MLPHVHECVHMCVCLCVSACVLPGPAGASQNGKMWLHAPTHKKTVKADIDLWQDK